MKLTPILALALTARWAVKALPGPNTPPSPKIRTIYTFPNNTFLESLAVRSNSNLLITSMSVPHLYSLNPTTPNPTPSIIHTFPNITGIAGITETTPDVFALVTANWDLANTRAYPGTLAVWTVDLSKKQQPIIRLVTYIPNSTIINGLTSHPSNPRIILGADSSSLGAVWRIDLVTGNYEIAFSSPLFTPTGTAPGTNLGINGLRASGNHLYFTNSAQGFFGRVKIDKKGNKIGEIEIISESPEGVIYDDIAIDKEKKRAWVASHPDYVVEIDLSDGKQRVVKDETRLLNPTSATFGRGGKKEKEKVYVTVGGQFVGWDLVGNGIVALDL
ncbi:hypothetical protein QBC38DRAFT_489867 [Podospora fimiseda]|uniref:SMP-30/Gluconolactonase/LRE-like region domain-containing protein n=1 Tax=Podospora fimiseda TaxID=252190 RepID=A0AAN6YNB4_9PEZI|nr:hypothetical protein QBC38DRAFT_489867 [Podospora fimiseda]